MQLSSEMICPLFGLNLVNFKKAADVLWCINLNLMHTTETKNSLRSVDLCLVYRSKVCLIRKQTLSVFFCDRMKLIPHLSSLSSSSALHLSGH